MSRSALKNVMNMLDDAKNELPVEQAFLNDLKRSIELEDEANYAPGSKTYKPSSMNCIRQSYYTITGVETSHESNSNLVGICESGSDRHERIQRAVSHMRDYGIDCEYINVADFVEYRGLTDKLDVVKRPDPLHGEFETKLYHKTLNMSFLCDGIVKYKNHYYILEIKTENSNKFWQRSSVDPSHYHQATAYSIAFGINQVLFLYECRDNCDKRAFMFTVTDDMKQGLMGYIEECDNYIKKHIVPPIPENVAKKTCTYCSYRNQCGKDS